MEYEAVASNMADIGAGAPAGSHESWYHMLQSKLPKVESWAFDLLVCGIVAFVAGFMLKNFGKMLIFALVIAFAVAYGLDATQYYAVPWNDIWSWFGFGHVSSWAQAVDTIITWVKEHPMGFVSAALGLIIGWKVG